MGCYFLMYRYQYLHPRLASPLERRSSDNLQYLSALVMGIACTTLKFHLGTGRRADLRNMITLLYHAFGIGNVLA